MLTRALSTCLRRLADSCVHYAVDVRAASTAACVGYASAGAAIPSRPASVCIIGSGPAGFYTAQEVRLGRCMAGGSGKLVPSLLLPGGSRQRTGLHRSAAHCTVLH